MVSNSRGTPIKFAECRRLLKTESCREAVIIIAFGGFRVKSDCDPDDLLLKPVVNKDIVCTIPAELYAVNIHFRN